MLKEGQIPKLDICPKKIHISLLDMCLLATHDIEGDEIIGVSVFMIKDKCLIP